MASETEKSVDEFLEQLSNPVFAFKYIRRINTIRKQLEKVLTEETMENSIDMKLDNFREHFGRDFKSYRMAKVIFKLQQYYGFTPRQVSNGFKVFKSSNSTKFESDLPFSITAKETVELAWEAFKMKNYKMAFVWFTEAFFRYQNSPTLSQDETFSLVSDILIPFSWACKETGHLEVAIKVIHQALALGN